ncbi:copper resistance protein CopC [Siccirubricoccus sp. KC 17139]|uniref:Copper resistance protein CopC n=1 Tax=Siccirubricoccus soli TaxID=2899147 RepID=A0ABT1D0C8_9PROT|nr:copper resistance protein CopC [Siccirubricoccus soli]MCO6415332.1 copper resistance protein CopC [Siccirubricoccus soli]MCP2681464.1 copper resistance protein CopC [Siccirubricoccus soli]
MSRTRLACLFVALVALPLFGPKPAAAHAVVVGSTPAAAAVLPALPDTVTIRFNSRIDQARSRLLLVPPEGEPVALEPAPPAEPTIMEAPIPAGLAALPGGWRLRWQVLAIDGHITRGDIPFRLGAP